MVTFVDDLYCCTDDADVDPAAAMADEATRGAAVVFLRDADDDEEDEVDAPFFSLPEIDKTRRGAPSCFGLDKGVDCVLEFVEPVTGATHLSTCTLYSLA